MPLTYFNITQLTCRELFVTAQNKQQVIWIIIFSHPTRHMATELSRLTISRIDKIDAIFDIIGVRSRRTFYSYMTSYTDVSQLRCLIDSKTS